ncbi:MAG TPA: ABC transporter substrate-binding protein, partial [Thermoplasmata archaeon]
FIPKYTTKVDAATQLLRYLASAAGQTVQVKQGGHLATVLNVPANAYPTVDAKVAALLTGKDVLVDLDDTKGDPFQANFWSQLKGLWTSSNPAADLDSILTSIQSQA